MKNKSIARILLAPLLLLSLFSCGRQEGACLDGPTEGIGDREIECFFGSAEEIRGLYEALAGGDEGVKKYVADREAANEYYDDLPLVNSAAKARYLLKDTLDLPIAVFPEESFPRTHYYCTLSPEEGGDDGSELRIRYFFEDVWHYREERYLSVAVRYDISERKLAYLEENGGSAPVETLTLDGYSVKIYIDQAHDGSFSARAVLCTAGMYIEITIPVEDTGSASGGGSSGEAGADSGVKQAVQRLHKMRITSLRDLIGVA